MRYSRAVEDELRVAIASFGLAATAVLPMAGGLEAAVWCVKTETGAFAARRHTAVADAELLISSELAWLESLAAGGVALAPGPKRRSDGALKPVAETDGRHQPVAFWSVLDWIEGAPLDRLPIAAQAHATGATIASMHAHARNWTPPAGFTRPAYDASLFRAVGAELLAGMGDNLGAQDRSAVERALSLACSALDRLWSQGRDIGVIHADLHDGNLIWADGAARPTAIDFGRCGLAPLALDVAMAQHYLTPELGTDLLDGYLAAGAASTFDRSALPALRYLAAVENLAILSRFPDEAENVADELPWLVGLARGLAD